MEALMKKIELMIADWTKLKNDGASQMNTYDGAIQAANLIRGEIQSLLAPAVPAPEAPTEPSAEEPASLVDATPPA